MNKQDIGPLLLGIGALLLIGAPAIATLIVYAFFMPTFPPLPR